MNLKDRLIIAKQNSVKIINNNNIEDEINDIFSNMADTEDIIRSLINENKNIIFITNRNLDKVLFSKYINLLIKDRFFSVSDKFNEINLVSNSKINVFLDVEMEDFIKILGAINTGYKPFIFCLNINSYKNIICKLKALIAISHPNLIDEYINTLLSDANIALLDIEKKENHILIENIDLLEYSDKLELKNIYSISNTTLSEKRTQLLKKAIKKVKKEQSDVNTNEIEENIPEEDTSIDDELMKYNPAEHEIIQETESSVKEENDTEESNIKINKYKLLREKVRAKRENEENI